MAAVAKPLAQHNDLLGVDSQDNRGILYISVSFQRGFFFSFVNFMLFIFFLENYLLPISKTGGTF